MKALCFSAACLLVMTLNIRAQDYSGRSYDDVFREWKELVDYKRSISRVVWQDAHLRVYLARHADEHVGFLRKQLASESAVALILQGNEKLMAFARKEGLEVHEFTYSPDIQRSWLSIIDKLLESKTDKQK